MNFDEKINRIREATIQSISRNGLANSSVASIAKIAGVSDGYLYRHYAGKDELVRDVLDVTFSVSNEIIDDLLRNSRDIEHYIDQFIDRSFQMMEHSPDRFKFLVLIQNDFSYLIDDVLVDKMKSLCVSILEKCRDSANFRADLSMEDIYIAFIVIPHQYIKLILRDDFNITMSREEMTVKIKKMILGSLSSIK